LFKWERQSIHKVHGLTTAAAVWVAALFGTACGVGAYLPVLVAFALLSLVLIFGGSIERLASTSIAATIQ